LKIKKAFSNLQNKKIKIVQKIISDEGKPKPHINMTTKGPFCKQVIISISNDNANTFFKNSSSHVTNINRALKNIKLKVMADFICIENKSVFITTNKVASLLDLQNIEKYVKNTYNIKAEHTESSRFLQSKSFLKIIGIFYISKSSNSCITSEKIE